MKNTIHAVVTTAVRSTKLALSTALVLTATSGIASAQAKGGGVPELNAASMVSAVALMVGGALMLTDNFRRK